MDIIFFIKIKKEKKKIKEVKIQIKPTYAVFLLNNNQQSNWPIKEEKKWKKLKKIVPIQLKTAEYKIQQKKYWKPI